MKKRILVVSSANLDFVLNMKRVPGAGETVIDMGSYDHVPGGKGANAAVAVSRLDGDCVFCTRLGNDANGKMLKQFYSECGIDTRFVITDKTASTGLAAIMVESNGMNRIVVYPGANMNLCDDDVEEAFMCYPDALFVNFEIPSETVFTACEYAKKQEIPIFIDAGPADKSIRLDLLPPIEIFSPNESETYAFTGIEPTSMENCLRAASALYKKMNVKYIVIKLGERGCFIYDGIHYHLCAPFETVAVDSTAAGDAFTAALALEYLRCGDILSACSYANAVGSIVVSMPGASSSIPTEEKVRKFLKSQDSI
ncbi:MAG: ribokinase [Clostridia bacterium]|nr:ribokinase [Clostridia bacterium]